MTERLRHRGQRKHGVDLLHLRDESSADQRLTSGFNRSDVIAAGRAEPRGDPPAVDLVACYVGGARVIRHRVE